MPLTRSRSRSKPRSPAVNTLPPSTFNSPRTPAFLPPSHYAAAAGLPYPPVSHDFDSRQSRDFGGVAHSTEKDASDTSSVDSTHGTSSHFGAVGRLLQRSPSRSSLVRSSSKSSKGDKDKDDENKRQSQLGDIPSLEAHLLPSLNDTISRMTHPSATGHGADGRDAFEPSSQPRKSRQWPRESSSIGQSSHTTPNQSVVSRANAHLAPPTVYWTPHSPASPSIPTQSTSRIQGPDETPSASYETSKEPNTPKRPLKSALRTPRTPVPPTPKAYDELPPSYAGKSLRTAKSMTSNVQSSVHTGDEPNFPNGQSSRAHTRVGDEGLQSDGFMQSQLPVMKSRSRSNPSTPGQSLRAPSTFTTPQPTHASTFKSPQPYSVPRSSIPRPHFGSTSTIDSELDRKLCRAVTPAKLVVTNAVAEPSSSEGEDSDHEIPRSRNPTWTPGRHPSQEKMQKSHLPVRSPWRAPDPQAPGGSNDRYNGGRQPVGLGFQMDDQYDRFERRSSLAQGNSDEILPQSYKHHMHDLIKDEPEPDDLYLEEEHPVGDPGLRQKLLKAVQFQVPPDHKDSDSETGSDDSHKKSALMGIVDGLRMTFGMRPWAQNGAHLTELSQSESGDAYTSQGLAISGSDDLPHATDNAFNGVGRLPSVNQQKMEQDDDQIPDDASTYSDDLLNQEEPWPAETPRGSGIGNRRTSWVQNDLQVFDQQGIQSYKPRDWDGRNDSRSNPNTRRSTSVPPPPGHRDSGYSSSPMTPKPEVQHRRGQYQDPYSAAIHSPRERDSWAAASNSRSQPSKTPSRMDLKHVSPMVEEVVVYPQSPVQNWDDRSHSRERYDREREAFGIPPSLSFDPETSPTDSASDAEYEQRPSERPPVIRIDSSSSGRPSLSNRTSSSASRRSRDGAVLSEGAEALFDRLATRGRSPNPREIEQRTSRTQPPTPKIRFNEPPYANERNNRDDRRRSYSQDSVSIPPSSSEQSVYEEDNFANERITIRPPSPSGPSWRSTLQPSTFNTLLSHYGSQEMQRQEVIFELFVSEQAQIKRLRTIVRQFILPLRSRDSRSWLPGVPQEVSKLFDWLEDIVNLQVDIVRALKVATNVWQAGAIVEKVAEPLRAFVPRLEVYQPYLVRVAEVRELVAMCTREGDEFGQYVKLREREKDSDGWTLVSLLEEPVKRVTSYPELYTRLWELTPTQHPDYLSAISLVYSTRTIIHVMNEVKVREDEYDLVKDIASRIEGLTAPLAKRERRLLLDGPLFLSSSEPKIGILHSRSRSASGRRDQSKQSPRPIALQAFVFTDLFVLTTPFKRDQRQTEDEWSLLAETGLSRILGVTELQSQTGEFSATLTLLPMSSEQVTSGIIPDTTSVICVTVMLPFDREDQWTRWLAAFNKCYQYTIGSLSFPSHSGTFLAHGRNVDLELDTHQSVKSLLAAGLPLPKSPSIQIEEVEFGDGGDNMTQEREERGWWSLRFQQVLRELQRQDTPLFPPTDRTSSEAKVTRAATQRQASTYTARDTYS